MFPRLPLLIILVLLFLSPFFVFAGNKSVAADAESQNGFVSLWRASAEFLESFDFGGGFGDAVFARSKRLDAYLAENLYTSNQTAHTQSEYYAECSAGCSAGWGDLLCRVSCRVQSLLHFHIGGAGVGEGSGGPIVMVTNPSVSIDVGGSANATVVGDAYLTSVPIHWGIQDSCNCTSSPGNWWNGTLDGSGDGDCTEDCTVSAAFNAAGAVSYSLTCSKKTASACVISEQRTDSVLITPDWNSSVTFLDTSTRSVSRSQGVYLNFRATDIKTCTRSWTGGTLTLSGGNPQNMSVYADLISRDTTFSLSCTGFDGMTYSASWPVDFISSPTPYLYINNINLILIGPGSGGKSNKTQIGVTSGGFVGNVVLSASAQSSALTTAGTQFKFGGGTSTGTVTCTSGSASCSAVDFWVEIPGEIAEGVYNIIITADPADSDLESKTQIVPLRVRKFVPAFEEI